MKKTTKKTTDEKINNVDEQMRVLAEEKKALQRKKREEEQEEQKQRCHRRGVNVEKQLSDLAKLTDEQFDTFAKKVLLTEQTKRIISEILSPPPATPRSAKPPKSDDDFNTEQLTTQGNES